MGWGETDPVTEGTLVGEARLPMTEFLPWFDAGKDVKCREANVTAHGRARVVRGEVHGLGRDGPRDGGHARRDCGRFKIGQQLSVSKPIYKTTSQHHTEFSHRSCGR